MLRLFASLALTLLVLATSARADDIVVYRATLRLTQDAGGSALIPPSLKAYYVVNYTTGEIAQIAYYNRLGKRRFTETFSPGIVRGPLPKSKTGTIISVADVTENSATDFEHVTLFARGTDTALQIETVPAKRTIDRPRTFKGKLIYVETSNGTDARFQDGTLAAAVDLRRTVDANNGDKSFQTVIDDIHAELTAQGYQGQLM